LAQVVYVPTAAVPFILGVVVVAEGILAFVINPLSFVISEVFVGTVIFAILLVTLTVVPFF